MARCLRTHLPACAALLAWAVLALPGRGCPLCGMQGQTLTGAVNQAQLVLFGTLKNAKIDSAGDFPQGTTELHVEAVLKKREIVGDGKVVVLPRYVPTDNRAKFLIFCHVLKGKLDPYQAVPVRGDDVVKYLRGALAVKDRKVHDRLPYFFNYLDHADLEIATDAYKEFGNAAYADYRDLAGKLPADRIAKWLQDPNTPAFRYGLYGSLLGHCGTAKHAELLRKLLDDSQKRPGPGLDGLLAGYTMLKPVEGWAYLRDILKDPAKAFTLRQAALRVVRFFWDSRPDLVARKQMVEAVCLLLDQNDMADLAVDDLRKWGRWEVLDQGLALYGKASHDYPIIHRSILRFALSCPRSSKAEAFVNDLRRQNPEMVADVEETLK